ncbi:MAG: hypothetical protein CVV18_02360 [Gammaproteobacteria bacterium HGW-Gammaproteobacteria-8]|nr:MAG: hypothetical protein CVV18_02360 [Gammaproteobacteria bacterium HGW-Gammaproteobacteria-8]
MKAQFALPCLLALLLAAGSIVCSSANAQALRYRVTDLGTLGGPLANAFEINNHGVIVGRADIRIGEIQSTNAFLWRDGQLQDLGSLNEFDTDSVAIDLNEAGEVVGAALGPDPEFPGALSGRPFFWSADTGMLDITPDPNQGGLGAASAINAAGVVTGFWRDIGFRWSLDQGWAELPSLPDAFGSFSEPWAIDDAGTIVGRSFNASGRVVPVAWNADNEIRALPSFRSDGSGWARDINERGQIVGEISDPLGRTAPVLWQDDAAELIDFLPGAQFDFGSAEGINNFGVIVGWNASVSVSGIPARGWIRDSDGRLFDLNDLIIDPEGIWEIRIPLAINDRGQIVGIAVKLDADGIEIPGVAFLLDPVPEIDCALDLSRDGRLDDDDLFVLRGALGTDRGDADLNRDGRVDHLDLRQFLLRRARGECTEITPADSGAAEFSTIKLLPTQDPASYSQPAQRRTGSH